MPDFSRMRISERRKSPVSRSDEEVVVVVGGVDMVGDSLMIG